MKIDERKPRLALVYKSLLEQVAKVREYGLTKYPDKENWRTTSREDHYNATIRHIYAALEGEVNDESSGLPHLAHAVCNLMFLIECGDFHRDLPVTEMFEELAKKKIQEKKDEYDSIWRRL